MKTAPTPQQEGPNRGGAVFSGIGRRSAIDAVRARIAMAIELGLLQPGERLPDQTDIALGLSVSSMTARRAMTSLAEQGVVRRQRGRDGGTFVADEPPRDVLGRLLPAGVDVAAIHALVDKRMLAECAVTHFAAVNRTDEDLARLEVLTKKMTNAQNWSEYHQADNQFHQLVAEASHLGSATEVYNNVLAELYQHFIPYPIEALHRANQDHVALVAALERGDIIESVKITQAHVDVLHRTMFMELAKRTL